MPRIPSFSSTTSAADFPITAINTKNTTRQNSKYRILYIDNKYKYTIIPLASSTTANFPFCRAKCPRPAGTRAPPAGHSSSSYIANILFQIQNTKTTTKVPAANRHWGTACRTRTWFLLLGNCCKHLVLNILSSS